jgi:hypothetical protein
MRRRNHRIDDDDDAIFPVARDGETVRVRMALMDGFGHQPGYVQVSDDYVAMRRAARDAYIRDLTSAFDARDQSDCELAGPPWPSASSRSVNSKGRLTGYNAARRPLSWLRVRHASRDARPGSRWVLRP